MTNNITVKKNNTINKSTISSSNKSSKKDNEIKEKKTSKKESIDIQDFGSSDDEPILKKKKSTSKNNIPPSRTETKQETIHRNLDITILGDMKINDRYSKIIYLGLECIMDMTTGYINGPKFCSLASHESKRFDNYSRSDRYKNLLEYMKSSPEYSRAEIIKELKGGRPDLRGTYVHPDLILDVASWLSPLVLIKVSKILNEWRKMSPHNEIRFHKDIGDAIKEGVGMFGNSQTEYVIRDKIALEENGIVEVKTPVGFIDVLTDTKIIEVKKYHNWKHALGQIECYGYFYPNRQKWIYLFDTTEYTDDNISTDLIDEICKSKDVFVKYI